MAAPIVIKGDDIEMKKKKGRPSSKKRRYLQLLKSNPQRDEKPKQLVDFQVQSVKKTLNDKASEALSRGQKKRLKKKEKFINCKFLEGKSVET